MKTSEDNHAAVVMIATTGVAAVLAVPVMGTFLPLVGWSLGVLGLGVAGNIRESLGTAGDNYVNRRKSRRRKR